MNGGGQAFWSHGTSTARGVCILISKKLNLEIQQFVKDTQGRYIILKCKIDGEEIVLANIYAPNTDSPEFFVELLEQLGEIQGKKLILGDFNTVLDPMLDRPAWSPSKKLSQSAQVLLQFKEDALYTDVWRDRNPDKRIFTWRRQKQASRIDNVICEQGLVGWITNIQIIPVLNPIIQLS